MALEEAQAAAAAERAAVDVPPFPSAETLSAARAFLENAEREAAEIEARTAPSIDDLKGLAGRNTDAACPLVQCQRCNKVMYSSVKVTHQQLCREAPAVNATRAGGADGDACTSEQDLSRDGSKGTKRKKNTSMPPPAKSRMAATQGTGRPASIAIGPPAIDLNNPPLSPVLRAAAAVRQERSIGGRQKRKYLTFVPDKELGEPLRLNASPRAAPKPVRMARQNSEPHLQVLAEEKAQEGDPAPRMQAQMQSQRFPAAQAQAQQHQHQQQQQQQGMAQQHQASPAAQGVAPPLTTQQQQQQQLRQQQHRAQMQLLANLSPQQRQAVYANWVQRGLITTQGALAADQALVRAVPLGAATQGQVRFSHGMFQGGQTAVTQPQGAGARPVQLPANVPGGPTTVVTGYVPVPVQHAWQPGAMPNSSAMPQFPSQHVSPGSMPLGMPAGAPVLQPLGSAVGGLQQQHQQVFIRNGNGGALIPMLPVGHQFQQPGQGAPISYMQTVGGQLVPVQRFSQPQA